MTTTTRSGARPALTFRDAGMADWLLRELPSDVLVLLDLTELGRAVATQPPVTAAAVNDSPHELFDLVQALCAGVDACSVAFQSAHRHLGHPLPDSPDQITTDLLGRDLVAAIGYAAGLLEHGVPHAAALWAQTLVQRAAYLLHYRQDAVTAGRLRTAAAVSLGARIRSTTPARAAAAAVPEGTELSA